MAPKATVSRKEKRKLERQEKKQRKNKRQRGPEPAPEPSRSAKPRTGAKPSSGSRGSNSARRGGAFQNKFHELVQETTGRRSLRRDDEEDASVEDAEIKALETKLGLNSKKDGAKRLQKEYAMDGLGDDFVDFLSSLDNISKIVKERKKKDDKQPQRRSHVEEESEEEEEEEDEEHEEDEEDDEMGSDFDDMEMDEETRREFELLQQEDAEFLKGMDELPTDESEVEEEDDLAAFDSEEDDDEEDDDEVARNTMRNAALASADEETDEEEDGDEDEDEDADSASEEEEEEQEEQEDAEEDAEEESDNDDEEEQEKEEKEEVEIEEDIYGRPVIKQREEKKPSAYIPPHLRRQMQQQQQQQQSTNATDSKAHLMSTTMDEQALRELTRRVNGQLNRISENNMESIALEMEKFYREHGRSIVNAVLLDKVVQTSCHPRQVMTPLIKVCGALIAALYHSIGTEIGGFFMEKFVMKLIETVEKTTSELSEISESDGGDSSKEAVNLLLLVAMLYNFGVVQCTLIYDLFRRFLDNFTSTEIELIHHLLKACGHQLRADDQDALREMVASVQQKVAATSSSSTGDERVRFILDLIYELKKPAKHSKKGASGLALNAMSASGAMDLTSLKKWLGRVKTRCGNANNALRVSLHEILHAEQNGRWWVVGGTWVGYRQANAAADDSKAADQAEENRLLKLAEKQRMNTDVRKRIFVAIMGAADCLDAYERLLQLHLKEKQEREIVRVILHCCGHEKQFNRFYVVLSDKLCEMDPRYKFTYQLAFWDTFKQLESFKPRRLYNMAQLLAGMLMSGSLSLSVLKVLDFTSLDEPTVLFVRITMEKIMQMEDEAEMTKVFERVLATKKARLTLDGLAVYFHQHMPRYNAETGARQVLKTRTKTVKRLLDMLTKAAVSAEASAEFK